MHYLHIILGCIVGFPLGFALHCLIASRTHRQIAADQWRKAHRFYTGKN